MNPHDGVKSEYDKIIAQISDPGIISDWERFEELSKRKAYLEKIIEKEAEIANTAARIEENKLIIASADDPDLTSLALAEVEQLNQQKNKLDKELEEIKLANKKSSGPDAAVVEIRAGTGGEEAALFAGDLYAMYSKFAQNRNWKQKILDSSRTEIGGFKEIIFELKGASVWEDMRYEGGVHRIQRIPITEKSGRIHTSTATVAVLPKPKKNDFKIRPDQIKVDFYCSSGPGGQYVNKRESAVRITHLPTGIAVSSQTERNQLQNKDNAMALLEYRVAEKLQHEADERMGGQRRDQIGSAKRAEKIRTYNIPQDRITDHRIKKNWHDIEGAFNGNLANIVADLRQELDNPAANQ